MTDPPLSPHPLFYAPPATRRSLAGIISFVCGVLVLSFFLFPIAVNPPPGSYSRFIGILMFAALVAVLLLGLVTGILGILPPHRKRALAIIGLALNLSLFLLILMITIVAWRRNH